MIIVMPVWLPVAVFWLTIVLLVATVVTWWWSER